MNVSSVKNLNGEVFSAVQDASLTNVVQTNSGNWQDITAYQSNSASYLTAHQDLSDYQTTAGMTAYQAAGDYVQGSDLELNSYNKISAISGHELAGGGGSVEFDYDENNAISGINGSAIRYPDSSALLPYPMEFIETTADATGANILYVVTGV